MSQWRDSIVDIGPEQILPNLLIDRLKILQFLISVQLLRWRQEYLSGIVWFEKSLVISFRVSGLLECYSPFQVWRLDFASAGLGLRCQARPLPWVRWMIRQIPVQVRWLMKMPKKNAEGTNMKIVSVHKWEILRHQNGKHRYCDG